MDNSDQFLSDGYIQEDSEAGKLIKTSFIDNVFAMFTLVLCIILILTTF